MREDRGIKILLALIAAGLWGLLLAQAGIPDLMAPDAAAAEEPAVDSVAEEPGLEAGPIPDSLATLPLRWKIPWATQRTTDTTYCGTAIVLVNETDSAVDVEVEWYHLDGGVISLRTGSTIAFGQTIWITGDDFGTGDVDYRPLYYTNGADLFDFLGYARVFADDPRIQAAAFQYCRDGLDMSKNIMAITQIPVYPVGSTADYFLAGRLDAGALQVAVANDPQVRR